MTERDTYAFVKNLNRQGKAASKEPKKRGNDDYENVPTYAMVEMQLPSSRAIGLKEETKASKTESETSYAVVVGSHFSSPVIKTQAYNGNVTGLEEDPCYSFVRSSLPSPGVNGAMENSNAPETQENLAKNGRQPTISLITFIITVIILLTVIIALIIWNTQLSNKLNQSIQNLAEKDKKSADLNISYGNFTNELKEIKGNFYKLISNIQSVCEGKDLPDLKIPDTLLSRSLYQSVQNLAEKDKKCLDLRLSNGNLNKELQENKRNFAKLVNNIQSVCEGKEPPDLRIHDTLLSSNLHKSIQNLAKIGQQCAVDSVFPTEWTRLGKFVYYFSESSKTWSDGKICCTQHGGRLVKINTEEKQNFLKLRSKGNTWIGMSDIDEEGKWIWTDGTSENIKPGFWCSGEPNDYKDHRFKGEDCGALWNEEDCQMKWNDVDCQVSLTFICEKEIKCNTVQN